MRLRLLSALTVFLLSFSTSVPLDAQRNINLHAKLRIVVFEFVLKNSEFVSYSPPVESINRTVSHNYRSRQIFRQSLPPIKQQFGCGGSYTPIIYQHEICVLRRCCAATTRFRHQCASLENCKIVMKNFFDFGYPPPLSPPEYNTVSLGGVMATNIHRGSRAWKAKVVFLWAKMFV